MGLAKRPDHRYNRLIWRTRLSAGENIPAAMLKRGPTDQRVFGGTDAPTDGSRRSRTNEAG